MKLTVDSRQSTAALLLMLVACSPSTPIPLGNLTRPSGLLYRSRTSTLADVYIADSLADGVRVAQLSRQPGQTPPSAMDDFWYVPAPIAFFPLVIPAEGFPTRLAQSAVDPNRIFALAPYAQAVYVIDAAPVPWRLEDAQDFSNNLVGSVSLADVFINPATPTAFAAFKLADGDDGLLIAFDVLGSPNAAIAAIAIHKNADGGFVRAGMPETASIEPAPRDMILRSADHLAAVTSADAGSSWVTVVEYADAPPILKRVGRTDVGGPTAGLIDAAQLGVMAIRLDRAAVVVLDVKTSTASGTTSLVRSTRSFSSPYTPDEEFGTPDLVGRIDLINIPAVSGAYGRMIQVWDLPVMAGVNPIGFLQKSDTSTGGPGLCATQSCGDVISITHLDAHASFLVGNPPRLALSATTAPILARVLVDEGPVFVDGCSSQGPICQLSPSLNLNPTNCRAPKFALNIPIATGATLKATYKGTLVTTRSATLRKSGVDADGVHFILSDGSFGRLGMYPGFGLLPGFKDRKIRINDAVLVQLRFPVGDTFFDTSERATVRAINSETELDIVPVSKTSTLSTQWPFSSPDQSAPVAEYEVYPGNGDVVLTQQAGLQVLRVLARTSTFGEMRTGTGSVAVPVMSASFEGRVHMTMSSSTAFTCNDATPPIPAASSCVLDTDCPAGSTCPVTVFKGCLDYCTAPCDLTSGMGSCVRAEIERHCSGVEIGISSVVASRPTYQQPTGGFLPQAPDQTVFSPLRQSFIVSFPGSRGVAEIRSDSTAGWVQFQFR